MLLLQNGLLTNPNMRACNRNTLAQTIPNLQAETLAFSAALDTNMALRGTIISGLDALVQSAVTNFQTYTGIYEVIYYKNNVT